MKTRIYLIRHCQPNYDNHDDWSRELTVKGLQDCKLIVDFFETKLVDKIFSSPYKRAFDTVLPLAEKLNLSIETIADFRERKLDSVWVDDFDAVAKQQWSDFSFKLSDGESLSEVQERNMQALTTLLQTYPGESLLVGSHGTAISTIINAFVPTFDYEDFQSIKSLMPFILEIIFDHNNCQTISLYNPFTGEKHDYFTI